MSWREQLDVGELTVSTILWKDPSESGETVALDIQSDNLTTGVQVSGDVTNGVVLSGAMTTGIKVSGATTEAIDITGSATRAINVDTGTFTTGIELGGTLTTGLEINAATTGILISGATTEAIDITGNATRAINIDTGTFTTGILLAGTLTTGLDITAATTAIDIGAGAAGILFTGALTGQAINFAAAYGGTSAANAIIMGGGTSGDPMTTATASKVFMEFRTESTATSGDSRCLYMRHAIKGVGGGGESLRSFTKVDGVAASTVRGAHISIDFATSGSVTGFGAGVDAQVMYANETNASTLTCINLEMYAGGASTDVSGLNSFIRCVFNGTQGGIDNFDDDAVLLSLVGATAGAGQLFDSTIDTTDAQIDHTLKINIGGTNYYIGLMDNANGS